MKKILSLVAGFFCGISAFAADPSAILAKIENANAGYQTLTCKIDQIRTLPNKSQVNMACDFYFRNSDKLAMIYTEPATDRLIINGNSLYLNRGGKASKFSLDKSAAVGSLATSLLNAITGHIQNVADANNADYTVVEDSKFYIVTVAAKQKAPKGYAKITLYYRKSDCLLETMKMEEFTRVTNVYKMNSFAKNVSVDDSVFKF
ncbi:MAG: outer-membrane lipoprotein carrier protein LolA [Bacteroidales bacterium]|nr:outer-membrane lipoprotein carrier protein LolA [Bacteroidales bacterium]